MSSDLNQSKLISMIQYVSDTVTNTECVRTIASIKSILVDILEVELSTYPLLDKQSISAFSNQLAGPLVDKIIIQRDLSLLNDGDIKILSSFIDKVNTSKTQLHDILVKIVKPQDTQIDIQKYSKEQVLAFYESMEAYNNLRGSSDGFVDKVIEVLTDITNHNTGSLDYVKVNTSDKNSQNIDSSGPIVDVVSTKTELGELQDFISSFYAEGPQTVAYSTHRSDPAFNYTTSIAAKGSAKGLSKLEWGRTQSANNIFINKKGDLSWGRYKLFRNDLRYFIEKKYLLTEEERGMLDKLTFNQSGTLMYEFLDALLGRLGLQLIVKGEFSKAVSRRILTTVNPVVKTNTDLISTNSNIQEKESLIPMADGKKSNNNHVSLNLSNDHYGELEKRVLGVVEGLGGEYDISLKNRNTNNPNNIEAKLQIRVIDDGKGVTYNRHKLQDDHYFGWATKGFPIGSIKNLYLHMVEHISSYKSLVAALYDDNLTQKLDDRFNDLHEKITQKIQKKPTIVYHLGYSTFIGPMLEIISLISGKGFEITVYSDVNMSLPNEVLSEEVNVSTKKSFIERIGVSSIVAAQQLNRNDGYVFPTNPLIDSLSSRPAKILLSNYLNSSETYVASDLFHIISQYVGGPLFEYVGFAPNTTQLQVNTRSLAIDGKAAKKSWYDLIDKRKATTLTWEDIKSLSDPIGMISRATDVLTDMAQILQQYKDDIIDSGVSELEFTNFLDGKLYNSVLHELSELEVNVDSIMQSREQTPKKKDLLPTLEETILPTMSPVEETQYIVSDDNIPNDTQENSISLESDYFSMSNSAKKFFKNHDSFKKFSNRVQTFFYKDGKFNRSVIGNKSVKKPQSLPKGQHVWTWSSGSGTFKVLFEISKDRKLTILEIA